MGTAPAGAAWRVWVGLGLVLAAALALRLAYVHEQRSDVLFEHPTLDADRYLTAARDLADRGRDERRAYWQPPGFQYALAAVLRVAGPGLAAPRYVQALLSVACCLLLFLLGRRLFSAGIGLAAAALLAVHGVVIHASAELLPAIWMTFFDLVALLLLLQARDRACVWRALGAGLALGVSAVFKPVILAFLPVALLWLWPAARGWRRAALAVALLVGIAAPIAPVTAHNWRRGREVVLVSTNGGLNFYLGNNERSAETLAVRPGRHWEELEGEGRRAGVRRPGAESSYFYRRGFSFWLRHPGAAVGLTLRKVYLYWNGGEIPRDADLYADREASWVLKATVLPGPLRLPNGVLLPLALVGLVTAFRERRRLGLVLGYVGVQVAVVAGFFVTSRYRVPATPVLALLAVVGAVALWQALARGRWPARVALAAGVLALIVLANLPTREAAVSLRAEVDFYRGLAYQGPLADPTQAVVHFRRAAAQDPRDPRAPFELGNVLGADGRHADAVAAWEQAALADPWDVRPRRRAAATLVRLGDRAGAMRALRANLESRQREPSTYAFERFNLGVLLAQEGQTAAAVAELRAALRLDRRFFAGQASAYARAVSASGEVPDPAYWQAVAELLEAAGDAGTAAAVRPAAASSAPPAPATAPGRR